MKDWEHIIQRILIALLLMAIIAGTLWKVSKKLPAHPSIEKVKVGLNSAYGDENGDPK